MQQQTHTDTTIQPYGDNCIPVIPTAYQEHSQAYPFCYDETCPCHHDEGVLAQVQEYVAHGLLTDREASLFVSGKTV